MRLEYPQKANGLYIIKKCQFDDIAALFLSEHIGGFMAENMPQTIDIDYIAEEFLGLTITDRYLSPDKSILGLINFCDIQMSCFNREKNYITEILPAGTVVIDCRLLAAEMEYYRRYTVAHEAAHWILHRSFHSPDNREYSCRNGAYIVHRAAVKRDKNMYFWNDYDWEEWQADTLAAALLMPVEYFRCAMLMELSLCDYHGYSNHLIEGIHDMTIGKVVSGLSELFGVSRTAVRIRIRQLGYLGSIDIQHE